MGTRGFYGLRFRGRYYLWFNRWDSYPTGLGNQLIAYLTQHFDLDEFRRLLSRLRQPADERECRDMTRMWRAYMQCAGVNVYDGDGCGTGDLLVDLGSGALLWNLAINDGTAIPCEIHLEWGYVVDLDDNAFHVYKGFGELKTSYPLELPLPTFTEEDECTTEPGETKEEASARYWLQWSQCMHRKYPGHTYVVVEAV